MTILVTGAGGQVGTELAARAGTRNLLALRRGELDIGSADAVDRCLDRIRPAVVINAAAYTAVDKAQSETELAYRGNRDGPAFLASACARLGVPLLHLSTDYVFDGSKTSPWTEDDAAAPLGVYGMSKWEGEQRIRACLPQHLIVRVAWVFGAQGANFVRTMLRLGRERSQLRVVDDQKGAPTYAGAIADVLLQLSDRIVAGESLPWGTYHYTGTPAVTWCEFARAIFAEAAKLGMLDKVPEVVAITSAEYPTPVRRPANSVLALGKTEKYLGITASPWSQGLCEVLKQWKTQA